MYSDIAIDGAESATLTITVQWDRIVEEDGSAATADSFCWVSFLYSGFPRPSLQNAYWLRDYSVIFYLDVSIQIVYIRRRPA